MEIQLLRQIHENEKTHWWYVVRRKIVHKLIKTCIGSDAKKLKILDVGCGAGLLTKELEKYGLVYGIDPEPEAVSFTRRRGANAEVVSIEAYQNPENFDLVVALDILEHCLDDKIAIENVNRLLKPGGLAIIFVPAFKIFWSEQDKISHHFRRYTYSELESKFKNAKFKTIKQSYFNFFLAPPILVIRKTLNFLGIKTGTEFKLNNRFLNSILKTIFMCEYFLLPHIKFPFGVSLLGVYKKDR